MKMNIRGMLPFVVCLALALPVLTPWRQAGASDWRFVESGGNADDEGDYDDETTAGGWDSWNAPPEPSDEGDDFGGGQPLPKSFRGAAGGPQVFVDPKTYKGTWLTDPVAGIPFALVITPGEWTASGRPVWNLRFAVKPVTASYVVEIPRLRAALLALAPYAVLRWREGRAGNISVVLPDGSFDTDTGTLVRRYRNAETVLNEFIAPALKNLIPGLRVAPSRAVRKGRQWDALVAQAGQQAGILARTGNNVTGQDAGIAEMRFEWVGADGTPMAGKAEASVFGVSFSTAYTSTTLWTIASLELSCWAKAHREAEQLLDSDNGMFNVIVNPQWTAAAAQISAGIQQKSGSVLTRIHEMSRQSFREAQEVRYRLDEKFRRALSQESVYQAPDGSTYLAPNTTNYAYVNPTTGETFATEREVPAGALPFGFDPMRLIEP